MFSCARRLVAVCLLITALASILVPFRIAAASSSASATATMTMLVVQPIQITRERNLNFGVATPGAPAFTVSAQDPLHSAEFVVRGEAGYAYSVTLPSDNEVILSSALGNSGDQDISVFQFTSNVTTGTLSQNGQQTVRVGATREALESSQTEGFYSGIFTVTVTYQ